MDQLSEAFEIGLMNDNVREKHTHACILMQATMALHLVYIY